MGAAQTKNVATATTKISNRISNTTTTNTSQVNDIEQSILINKCRFDAGNNIQINNAATTWQQSKQIASGTSSSSLSNDIQQSMLQEATSSVGSMGVGYATASNATNQFAESSNDVRNAVETIATQLSTNTNTIICNDSYFRANGDINISNKGSTSAFSDQLAQSENMTDIINKVSQKSEQKATAKVEGLAGFILALAVLVAAFGYSVAKPLASGGGKMLIAGIMIIILISITVGLYLAEAPPFFNEDNDCSYARPDIGGCDAECINPRLTKIKMDKTPLKYIVPVLPGKGKGNAYENASLLGMAVQSIDMSVQGHGNNAGYNGAHAKSVQQALNAVWTEISKKGFLPPKMKSPPPILYNPNKNGKYYEMAEGYKIKPGNTDGCENVCTPKSMLIKETGGALIVKKSENDPCACPEYYDINDNLKETELDVDGVMNLNTDEWNQWVSKGPSGSDWDSDDMKMLARFILLKLSVNMVDFSIYNRDNEIVLYTDIDGQTQINLAKNVTKNNSGVIYKWAPTQGAPSDLLDGWTGGGLLIGMTGTCNDNTYKLHKFMRNIGVYIMLLLVIFVFGYMFFTWKNANGNKNSSTIASKTTKTTKTS